MSTTSPALRGGLPEKDGDLDAFAAATVTAFAPPRRSLPASAPAQAADTPTGPPSTQPAATAEPEPREAPPAAQLPVAASVPNTTTGCTINVSADVRARFAHYQLVQKVETGHEPTNAVVVRRAVLHVQKEKLFGQLLTWLRQGQQEIQEEDLDPDGLFGEAPERRTERGRVKDSTQQSFRPSRRELAVIDALTARHGFPSRSDFLTAALDSFLPALPKAKTRTQSTR
ncbi:hypothetical protein RVR_P1106 (plasmid) [Actinacidiphila reveromycinica]|uniref:Uncharacterized protein n=1 Tax=Actinacidiphila reveromycinica TaxID=659352 RepID=A0A7R6QIG8_9ACTN|nr:hypothetical protein [Streptomyces sp. SN-593]BBG20723.1 hypothetical protein RVR_P1106 [Streptomyces sp. SN-593]